VKAAVKPGLKPATPKVWAMLRKLEALAERGVDGEKLAAQGKVDRLKARFDFSVAAPAETPDLFHGTFKRSSKARRIFSFPNAEFDVANSVKWAIESATGLRCLHRDRDLLAEASVSTATRLAGIAQHIAQSFRALIAQFNVVDGVSLADRGVFVMGLYDGMMNDLRDMGQRLPGRPGFRAKGRTKKPAPSPATGVHFHPYTLGVTLGRQIRFSVPLEEITAELQGLTQQRLTSASAVSDQQGVGKSSRTGKHDSTVPAHAKKVGNR